MFALEILKRILSLKITKQAINIRENKSQSIKRKGMTTNLWVINYYILITKGLNRFGKFWAENIVSFNLRQF